MERRDGKRGRLFNQDTNGLASSAERLENPDGVSCELRAIAAPASMSEPSRAPEWYRHGRLAAATHAIRSVPHETRRRSRPVLCTRRSRRLAAGRRGGRGAGARVRAEPAARHRAPAARRLRPARPRWLAVSPARSSSTPPDTSPSPSAVAAHVLPGVDPKSHVRPSPRTPARASTVREAAFHDPQLAQRLGGCGAASPDTPDRRLLAVT